MISRRLESEIVAASDVGSSLSGELFAILERHYDSVTRDHFESDLREKSHVILLRDAGSGEVRGFSTQSVMRTDFRGTSVRAVFSGDTIIDRQSWGEQELVRGWCRFAGRLRAAEPCSPLYWFLISKGYRTYLYLPLFYRDFLPHCERETPEPEQALLDTFARHKFGECWDPRTGLIRFASSRGQLKPDLAEVAPAQLRNPHVRYFLARNPEYASGVELACLAEIAPCNMRGLAAAMVREGEALGAVEESVRDA